MRRSWAVFAASVIVFVSADTASAIPAFARRYGVECHMCHQGFPKLNRTGHRFKERGYRLENEDPFKASDWIKSIPLRARASGLRYFVEGGDSFDSAFVKVISAGNLGSRLSYWADSGLLFDENEGSKVYNEPHDAWVRLELVPQGKLYVRAGRMELDLPFSQVRTPHLFSYVPYFMNSGREVDSIADYQHAVEIGGSLRDDVYHWSAAVTSGARDKASGALYDAAGLDDDSGEFEWNLFVRASRRGDSSRFGAFAYVGRNTLAVAPFELGRPEKWEDDLLRLGVDADVWPLSKLNVYGVYMYGSNSDSAPHHLGAGGSGKSATFQGGFVQADYHAIEKPVDGFLKEVALAATLRGNWTRVPSPGLGPRQSAWSVYPGLRFWLRERFRVAFEYGFEAQGRSDLGAVQAELVF